MPSALSTAPPPNEPADWTDEAERNLLRMCHAARDRFQERVAAGAPMTAATFVGPSAPPTPAVGTCCRLPGGLCPADPAQWESPTWTALGFTVDHPHRYSYAYDIDDSADTFVARAISDFDCDGKPGYVELIGALEADGAGDVRLRACDAFFRLDWKE